MVHLVLLPVMLLLKTSHNGDWMPPSQPAREGNNNTLAGKNTGKGCRGQVRSAPIEAGAKCDNSVVTMLICTTAHSNLCKNSHQPPHTQGHHLPLLMHPLQPPRLFPSFQIHLGGDFPMPSALSSSPWSLLLLDLGDIPSFPHLFWC